MDVVRHIIEKEKQKRKMKKRFLVKICLCNELFIANQRLCNIRALEILFRMNRKYYKE